jgi:small subunit ribosomal protein S20
MANHKSAKKRARQTTKKNAINRSKRSAVRTSVKKVRSAIAIQDKDKSNALLYPTISLIDKAVNKGILHQNTAARHKSRLTKQVGKLA